VLTVELDRLPSWDDLPDLLTAEEVAAFTRIPLHTIYLLIRRKELPARKFGRQIRVSKTALRAYVELVRLTTRQNIR
jgi:excisionase family DNA binding protein